MIPFHPLAEIFPLLEGEDFDALVEDIKKNGLREKIDLHQGKIADGRNRYRALRQLGIDPSVKPDKYFRKAIYTHTIGGEVAAHEQTNDDRVRAYIISKNIHRRHLTIEQKRDLIAKLLMAKPEASNRQIAKQVKVDHKTVGTVRKEKEATGEIPQLKKTIGADGKKRKQPAKKNRRSNVGRLMVEDANGKSKPATKEEEEAAAGDIFKRISVSEDTGTSCNVWAAASNPIIAAWQEGSEFDRANFVRLYLKDVLLVAEQIKQPNDDGLDIPDYLKRGAS